jgi:hypothetical protein
MTKHRPLFISILLFAGFSQPLFAGDACSNKDIAAALERAKVREESARRIHADMQKRILALNPKRESVAIREAFGAQIYNGIFSPKESFENYKDDWGRIWRTGTFDLPPTKGRAARKVNPKMRSPLPTVKELSAGVAGLSDKELVERSDTLSDNISRMMARTRSSYDEVLKKTPRAGSDGYEVVADETYSESLQSLALMDLRIQAVTIQELKKRCDKRQGFIDDSIRPHEQE